MVNLGGAHRRGPSEALSPANQSVRLRPCSPGRVHPEGPVIRRFQDSRCQPSSQREIQLMTHLRQDGMLHSASPNGLMDKAV